MEIKMLPVVKLTEVLRELQIKEWKELGEQPPEKGTLRNLPDGREDIFYRLWDIIANHYHGNQKFLNDSLFRFTFPTINNEPMSEDEHVLYLHCKEAVVNESLIFEVCW